MNIPLPVLNPNNNIDANINGFEYICTYRFVYQRQEEIK